MPAKDPRPSLGICLLILMVMPVVQSCANNSSGCANCLNSDTCSQCMGGYYINGAVCFACYSICKTCSGYFDCQTCYPGNYWDSTYLWCYKCPTGCSTCTSASCSTCATNYFLFSGSCQHCGAACTLCMDNVGCTTCPSGNYPQNNTCLSCPAACSSCTNPTHCQSCNGGFYLTGNSCVSCINGCNSCTSYQTCTNCIMNYYMKAGVCYSCGSNCNSCSNSVGCTQCSLSGMFIQNQTCIFCPSQCTACSNSSSCSHCSIGYYLSNSNCLSCGNNCASCSDIIGCTACSVNYYLSGGNCLSCGGYCSTCVAGSGCTQCSMLNMYISSQSCHFCSSGCRTCDSQLVCTSCDSGYDKSNSDCVLKQVGSPVQTTITVITTIAIVVPILLTIIIAIVIYIYCCRVRIVPVPEKGNKYHPEAKPQGDSFSIINPNDHNGRPNVDPIMPIDDIESISDPRIEQVDPKHDMKWVKVSFQHLHQKFPCELCKNQGRGIVVTSCSHVFHPQCLRTYMAQNKKCPKCPIKLHKNFYSICENCKQYGYKQFLPEIISRAIKREQHCRPL